MRLIAALLEDPRFSALIQKFVFYPVNDRQYLHAYNMLSEVPGFYQRIAKKVEDGNAGKEETKIGKMVRAAESLRGDAKIYLYILFSVALDFSLSILNG